MINYQRFCAGQATCGRRLYAGNSPCVLNTRHVDSSILPCFHPHLWATSFLWTTDNIRQHQIITKKKDIPNPQDSNIVEGKRVTRLFPRVGRPEPSGGWVGARKTGSLLLHGIVDPPLFHRVETSPRAPEPPFQSLSTCCGPANKKLTCQKKEIGFQWN